MTEDQKTCTKCGQTKSRSAFGPQRKQADGLHPHCRACKCEAEKARYAAKAEDLRAVFKANRLAKLELYKAREKRASVKRGLDAEYLAEQRRKGTERLMQAHRLRAPVHTCPVCGIQFCPTFSRQAPQKTCSTECSQELRAFRTWRKQARRRAWVKNATIEYVDPNTVFWRDNWTCHICGRPTPRKLRGTFDPDAPELDHKVPLSKGGDHSYANVACACRRCNIAKGNKTP